MNKPLTGKTIVLGITGSIAAYKGAEVARRLLDLGAEVHATLTRAGAEFITPLTLRTLTGNPVTTDMFAEPDKWNVKHIALAKRAAAVVVAPATANALAKLSLGIADEFLYALALATRAPLVLAPAMNDQMLAHEATQAHLANLRKRGATIVEPEMGRLASGAIGAGRLADPHKIATAVAEVVGASGALAGVTMLITAGPTREPLDPVRFISNRSSGKMGYALAEVAIRHGAQVSLVSGPTGLPQPAGCDFIRVETTAQMHQAVMERFPNCQVFISAGAPADWTPSEPASQKIKKEGESLAITLKPTADIVATCGENKKIGQVVVGFAAETENLLSNASKKLAAKSLDLIVANKVGDEGVGFDSDQNAGYLLYPDGHREEIPVVEKEVFAERVVAVIAKLLATRKN